MYGTSVFAFWMRKNISPKTFLMAVILTAVGVGVALTSDRLSEVVLVIVFLLLATISNQPRFCNDI